VSSQFGELKGASRPQEPNACRIRVTAQAQPLVTYSSLDRSKENYLIIIVGGGNLLNLITENFTVIGQEVLLIVFESWAFGLKWVIKHEEKYDTQ
jgi:hypothetical protein